MIFEIGTFLAKPFCTDFPSKELMRLLTLLGEQRPSFQSSTMQSQCAFPTAPCFYPQRRDKRSVGFLTPCCPRPSGAVERLRQEPVIRARDVCRHNRWRRAAVYQSRRRFKCHCSAQRQRSRRQIRGQSRGNAWRGTERNYFGVREVIIKPCNSTAGAETM
jgi:hypothetical protein